MKYFIFDVESWGLHGEGFAVAGGVYSEDGNTRLREFAFHSTEDSPPMSDDVKWVLDNVNLSPTSVGLASAREVRHAFWAIWCQVKLSDPDAVMAVECGWPVEARFLNACIDDNRVARNWEGPYPMHEIASIMLAAGMDPMATYERLPNELPAHEPLADSRQSARLLFTALKELRA